MGPVIRVGTPWRFARSSTTLQAQTLVLRVVADVLTVDENVAADEGDYAFCGVANTSDYVAVVTVDESFDGDQGDYTADGVASATDYMAVVTGDQSVAANEGTTLLMAWEMLLILLLLHRELGTVLSISIAMLLLLLSNSPAGSQVLLSTPPRRGNHYNAFVDRRRNKH